jgi:chitinase
VAVILSVGFIPTPDTPGQPWNYFVPIVNLADSAIDFYQPQAYNNGYDSYAGGSVEYLKDVYLNWCNSIPGVPPVAGYNGISGKKLLIGLEASPSAGGSSFYASPDVITKFKTWLVDSGNDLEGFMIWDSHWDDQYKRVISTACSE